MMRTRQAVVLAALTLLILAPTPAAAQATRPEDKSAQEVREVESRRVRYLAEDDLTQLERLLSDDLSYTHSSGVAENKTQFMAALRSGAVKYKSLAHSDVRARVYGDTVLLTGRSQVRVMSKGEDRNLDLRFTIVYAKQQGQWKMIAWQSSRLPAQ